MPDLDSPEGEDVTNPPPPPPGGATPPPWGHAGDSHDQPTQFNPGGTSQPPGHPTPQPGQPYPPYAAPQPYPVGYGPGYSPAPAGSRRSKAVLWMAALVVVLLLIGGGLAAYLVSQRSQGTAVADLVSADCITGDGLSGAESTISAISVTDCTDDHDAEVIATVDLTGDQTQDYTDAKGAEMCLGQLADVGTSLPELTDQGLELRPLTDDSSPSDGDRLACLVRKTDGGALSAPVL